MALQTPTQGPLSDAEGGPSRLLVVDDEAIILTLLSEVLTEEGYQVTTAGNGQEAIDLLERQIFDLVITDIVMPVVNGVEVLLAAKRIDIHYPVVVITGYYSVDSVVRLVNLGAADYIAKPFNVDLIRLTVAKVLQRRKVTDRPGVETVSGSLPALDGDSETYNAMILRKLLEAEVGRSLRHGRSFSLLMVRISRLEGYSAAGRDDVDREVIKMFAAILKDESGPGDIIGRTDLTEFAIIFPEADRGLAQTTAERIHHKAEWTFGVDYSVVEFPSEASDAAGLIDAARASLERASVGGSKAGPNSGLETWEQRVPPRLWQLESLSSGLGTEPIWHRLLGALHGLGPGRTAFSHQPRSGADSKSGRV